MAPMSDRAEEPLSAVLQGVLRPGGPRAPTPTSGQIGVIHLRLRRRSPRARAGLHGPRVRQDGQAPGALFWGRRGRRRDCPSFTPWGAPTSSSTTFTADGSNPNNSAHGPDTWCRPSPAWPRSARRGCGFEHQLASVRAALDPALPPTNVGFLRADAFLAVVLVTNEDDCSASPRPPTSSTRTRTSRSTAYLCRASAAPTSASSATTSSLFCPTPELGRAAVPAASSAPNPGDTGPGRLYRHLTRYIDYFTKPARVQGGLKPNPLDVVLVGIDAPRRPGAGHPVEPRHPPRRARPTSSARS